VAAAAPRCPAAEHLDRGGPARHPDRLGPVDRPGAYPDDPAHGARAALSIALAANIKLFPALIALYWLGRRDWESLAAFLVWGGLIVAAQLIVDANDTFAYFRTIGFDQVAEGSGLRNISPWTWFGQIGWLALLLAGCVAVLAAARTRWGWAAAVTVATLAPPRLLVYMLSSLLAGVRIPRVAGQPDPDDRTDPARAYARSFR
jgi:hypothetical protein